MDTENYDTTNLEKDNIEIQRYSKNTQNNESNTSLDQEEEYEENMLIEVGLSEEAYVKIHDINMVQEMNNANECGSRNWVRNTKIIRSIFNRCIIVPMLQPQAQANNKKYKIFYNPVRTTTVSIKSLQTPGTHTERCKCA